MHLDRRLRRHGPTRRLSAYGAMMVAAALLGLAKYVLVAKLLTAEDLGYYGLVLIVLPFGVYLANWGALHALNVRLPIMLGKRDLDSEFLVDRSLGFVLLSTSATSSAYLAIVLVAPMDDFDAQVALAIAAGTIALTTFTEFYIFVVRVHRRIERLAAISLTRATLAITFGGVGAALGGYRGLLVGELLALALSILVGVKLSEGRKPARPRVAETRALLIAGAPLLFADVVVALRFSLDRIFVASTLADDLGQYTIASIVAIGFGVLLAVTAQAMYPQFLFDFGSGLALVQVRRRLHAVLVKLIALALMAGVFLWPVRNWLADGFLSEYAEGLSITPLLYVGGILSLLSLYGVLLLAAERFVLTMVVSVGAAVTGIVGGFVVARSDPSISNYALVFVATQFTAAVYFIIAGEYIMRRQPTPQS